MAISAFAQLHSDLTDHVTGLPRYASALVEIPHLARRQEADRALGVIAFAILPDAALYRLTPETAQALRADVSRRIAELLKEKDRLYTISHWEWLAVLPDLPSSAPLPLAMLKLAHLFADPVSTPAGPVALQVSCGGALWPDHGEDALHLVQSARIARLAASRDGAGQALYDPGMEHNDAGQQALHAELALALGSGRGLGLHLQPQVGLADGTCVGCEALLRWQRDNGEWVPPQRTLAIVERLGLRSAFTRWLLQQAMQLLTRLDEAGVAITLSVNLSASDLLDTELPDLVSQSLATWEIPPERLLLELTETAMVEETQQVVDVLERLRTAGLRLSLDDFGTGYAGMSYLQRLPVQEVKIDRSFVSNAGESKKDREIIAAIVKLAHRLKMSVIAEGVETAAVAAVIARLGGDRAQGFLYARPMAVDAFIAWWRSHRPEPALSEPARKRGTPRRPLSA